MTYCQEYYRKHRETRLAEHRVWRAANRGKAVEYENARRVRNPGITSYNSMMARCYDPKHDSYKRYGAMGVTVCDRWNGSYVNFRTDMGLRPAGMTLDRINPYGNYEPCNCRWATWSEQNKNKRTK
jgi:hypothetical protein